MVNVLPQQRLLLELITYSGDIGVPDMDDTTVFSRTMSECKAKGWITVTEFGAGVRKLSITDYGRVVAKQGKEAPNV